MENKKWTKETAQEAFQGMLNAKQEWLDLISARKAALSL